MVQVTIEHKHAILGSILNLNLNLNLNLKKRESERKRKKVQRLLLPVVLVPLMMMYPLMVGSQQVLTTTKRIRIVAQEKAAAF